MGGEVLMSTTEVNILPAKDPRPDCPKCWGTGFTIVQLKNSSYAVAARCSCLAAAAKEGGRAN